MATPMPITRRSALQVALAAPFAAASTVSSQIETPIMCLYRQHKALYFAPECAPEDEDRLIEAIDRLETAAMAAPTTCLADLAAKFLISHGHGGHSCLGEDSPFMIEARALVEGLQ